MTEDSAARAAAAAADAARKVDIGWQPATSQPGELFTVEGRIQAIGAGVRNLKDRDPRYVAHKRSMWRVTAGLLGLVLVLCVLAFLLAG